MCGSVFFRGGENVFGDGVENGRVFAKEMDVEDFLWVRKTEMLESGVEACVFGTEIGNS